MFKKRQKEKETQKPKPVYDGINFYRNNESVSIASIRKEKVPFPALVFRSVNHSIVGDISHNANMSHVDSEFDWFVQGAIGGVVDSITFKCHDCFGDIDYIITVDIENKVIIIRFAVNCEIVTKITFDKIEDICNINFRDIRYTVGGLDNE